MYGLIVKLTAVSGAREELIRVLRENAVNMPGCLSYVDRGLRSCRSRTTEIAP